MAGASSRLLLTFISPISMLRHRPFSLLLLARRHSCIFTLPTLSSSNSLIPIKFSQKFHFRSTSSALQQNSHAHADDYGVRPSHPWPEWSRLLESLSAAGYFNGNSNIEDEFVANENLSMEFVAAARSCLAFARDRPDLLRWLRRQDIEVLINDGSPYLFKNAIETERRMRSFLQAEESHEARTADLMKYILSYASNPIIYPERNIKELTESSARYLLREMVNLSRRGQGSERFQSGWRDEQMPRNLGPNVTMKRGDWICPKCSFMNFARNTKCLECEELRPQRQLTAGEWDCPQCNFFNYRSKVACLKCGFRLPEAKTHYCSESGNNLRVTNKNLDQFLGNDSTFSGRYNDCIDRGQNNRKDSRSDSSYAKKPEKTTNEEDNKPERWFKKVTQLHGVTDLASLKNDDFSQIMPVRKGENSFEVGNNKERQPMQQLSTSSFAPFVPFPPDYFAKKNETSSSRSRENTNTTTHDNNTVHETGNKQMSRIEARRVWSNLGQTMAENPNQETGNQQMIEARPEWSNNGQTTPENLNLVQETGNRLMRTEARPKWSNLGQTMPENPYLVQETGNQQLRKTEARPEWSNLGQTMPINLNLVQETGNQHKAGPEWSNHGQTLENPNLVQETGNQQLRRTEARPKWSNLSQTTPENSNGWMGKSLEGSAVTEPDPLDMSEEAKAERWFRRVAQIKDISELSEIPDEDFPSIMPMRKGVNRFVVSKRKTPLERRLTSPQYRKNLRVMSSEPMKKEGDNDS